MLTRKEPIEVVAAALIDARGRVLMQRRPPGGAHAGLWEFPGGKVEPGETFAAALARELAEELDIAVAEAAFDFVAAADAPPIRLTLYLARSWTDAPRATGGAALGWYPPEELAGLDLPPADRPLVTALRARI